MPDPSLDVARIAETVRTRLPLSVLPWCETVVRQIKSSVRVPRKRICRGQVTSSARSASGIIHGATKRRDEQAAVADLTSFNSESESLTSFN